MWEFFNVGQPGYYLLILVFLACIVAVFMFRNAKKRPATRAEDLQKKYAVMTSELLAETADDALVNAVIANLMTKLARRHPDPLITLPRYSHGRNAVYFTWMLVKEVEHNGVEALRKKPAVRFVDVGIEGLVAVGAEETAQAVRKLQNATEQAEQAAAVLAALEKEQPLTLCVEYIRNNPEEFLDQ